MATSNALMDKVPSDLFATVRFKLNGPHT